MHNASDGSQAEQIAGNQWTGICAEINQGHDEVRQNVLHVIAMRSAWNEREKKESESKRERERVCTALQARLQAAAAAALLVCLW